MDERNKKTELLVGMFLTLGLIMLGLLILQFGSIRELFKTSYAITVALPDGSGLKEGSPVMLGGSRIGKVSRTPELNSTFNGVIIPLEIYHDKKIPADAKFGLGTSGLLGDVFVEIKPSGRTTHAYIEPGTAIPPENTNNASGISALTDTAKDIGKKLEVTLEDLRKVAADVRVSLKSINEGVLAESSMKDLKTSFTHLNNMLTRLDEKTLDEKTTSDLKQTISNLKKVSETLDTQIKHIGEKFDKLDPVLEKTDKVMAGADKMLTSADKAVKTIDDSAAALGRAANDIRRGSGLLPALINDAELKNEFKMLITNLRQRGVLWYKDKAGEEQKHDATQPRPPLSGTKR